MQMSFCRAVLCNKEVTKHIHLTPLLAYGNFLKFSFFPLFAYVLGSLLRTLLFL